MLIIEAFLHPCWNFGRNVRSYLPCCLFKHIAAPDWTLRRFECTNCVRDLWNLLPWMLERVHLLSFLNIFCLFLLLHSCSCGLKSLFCNKWMDPWGVAVWNISKIHDGITHAHYVKIKKSHYIDIGIWGESVLKFCAQN